MDAALVARMVDAHEAHDDRALLATYAAEATVHVPGWAEPVDAGVVVLETADGLVTAERHSWPTVQSTVQLGLVRPRSAVR